MLRRAGRARTACVTATVRAAEHDRRRPAPAVPGAAVGLPVAEQRARGARRRAARVLSLASGSSGAAVAVRSRSRVADVRVRDRVRRDGRAEDMTVVAAARKIAPAFDEGELHMATKILIPTPLRPFTDKQDAVEVDGATVGELLADLTTQARGLKAHLYNEQGKLRSFVNVYLNDEDIRYLQKEQTPVKPGDTLSIIPSVAGGAPTRPRTLPEPSADDCDRTAAAELTNDEIKRYSRHLIMPEVGVDGQRKLKAGERAVHRRRRPRLAGGDVSRRRRRRHASASSTSTSSTSATCSGRSPRHAGRRPLEARVGEGSAQRAQPARRRSRPTRRRCRRRTRCELFEPYDVILDGTDNFPTRYLVNDACVLLGKPNAYGSIFRFEGQASVFATKDGPCYRCLYPEPPPPGLVPSCAEGGVLGVLPGIIGVIQATEAIKLIIGIGEPLIGRFLIYDALKMSFRELKLRKDPDCPVCGTHPTVTKLIDYEQFCGIRRRAGAAQRARAP